MTQSAERFTTIRADLDFEAANEELYRAGMTDGLPVIPPTAERVERMLRANLHQRQYMQQVCAGCL